MVIPQFLRFYTGYTAQTLMSEYAQTFFSLVNAMFRIKALEQLDLIHANTIQNMEKKDAEKSISELRNNARGLHGIIQEVRNIKK